MLAQMSPRRLAIRTSVTLLAALLLAGLLYTAARTRAPTVSISVAEILSTSGQAETVPITNAYRMVDEKKEYVVEVGAVYQRFLDRVQGGGPSQIFLVDAPNVGLAIDASADAFGSYRPANVPIPVNAERVPKGKYWLAVNLGTAGSSPIRWIAEGVEIDGNTIRFDYHTNPSLASSLDIQHYYYWVPLGTLPDGVYCLELYDTSLKTVTLMRRVEVLTPKR
jgi:hypothetical protein